MKLFLISCLIMLAITFIVENITKYQNNNLLDDEEKTNIIIAEIYKKEIRNDFVINYLRNFLGLQKLEILRVVYRFELEGEEHWGFEWIRVNSNNEELIYRILRNENITIVYLKNDYSINRIKR